MLLAAQDEALPHRQTEQRHVRYRVPRSATVRRERAPVASRLLLVVQLDSERGLDRAAADGWFRQEGAVSPCAPAHRPERACPDLARDDQSGRWGRLRLATRVEPASPRRCGPQ